MDWEEEENEEESVEEVSYERPLETPRCFANIRTGDLFIVWWNKNAPVTSEETGWVEISERAWSKETVKRRQKCLYKSMKLFSMYVRRIFLNFWNTAKDLKNLAGRRN